jgi:hypothetical protein
MKKLRRVDEADVIAEFLKNEFYQTEFHRDRQRFEQLVMEPDTADAGENALRRALLFRRRGHMWRELPADTEWWEVEVEPEDLGRIRVFPRAQWRKVADGSFLLGDVAERLRRERFYGRTREFVARVQALSYQLRHSVEPSAVMLIGVDENSPFTIIEGNHRMTAAALASPPLLRGRFRVLCAFSPRMTENCWYQSSFANLWRYARNRLRNLREREADVNAAMRPVPQSKDFASITSAGTATQQK